KHNPKILRHSSHGELGSILHLLPIIHGYIWKQPKYPSMDECIKKMWYVYTMEFYSATKKKEILPFATT
uniref:Uncharacterized protein n=1 Tax=Equus asinus asinus TaxID=83772 RepID=A0A8C4LLK9_EQUAS